MDRDKLGKPLSSGAIVSKANTQYEHQLLRFESMAARLFKE